MKGKLIIIEGLDGAGKSTHISLLQKQFKEKGYKTYLTREPGGTVVGEEIRKILKSDIKMSISTQAYLFAAARNENNPNILELINKGYIVFLDRSFLTSYVYQGKDIAEPINKYAMDILSDIKKNFIIFDVDYETFKYRIKNRNEKEDRYEKLLQDKEHFNSLRNKYIELSEEYGSIIFNTSNISIENIEEENKKLFNNILKIFEEE